MCRFEFVRDLRPLAKAANGFSHRLQREFRGGALLAMPASVTRAMDAPRGRIEIGVVQLFFAGERRGLSRRGRFLEPASDWPGIEGAELPLGFGDRS